MTVPRRIAASDIHDAAEGLQRLVAAVRAGQLDASDAVVARLEAAIRALSAISGERPQDRASPSS